MHFVTEATYVSGHKITVRFGDGSCRLVDLAPHLDGPVFEPLKDIAYWMVAALEESEIVIQGLSDAANRLQRQKDTIADQYLAERVDSLALLKQQRDQLENTNKQMKAILAIMK